MMGSKVTAMSRGESQMGKLCVVTMLLKFSIQPKLRFISYGVSIASSGGVIKGRVSYQWG